jgi:hypothetical protein
MLLNTPFDHNFNFPVGSYIASTAVVYDHSRNFVLYLPEMNKGVLLLGVDKSRWGILQVRWDYFIHGPNAHHYF